MSYKILHLIEPLLFDQTGHGFSYVQSLLQANQGFGFNIHLWLDKRGKNLLSKTLCTAHAYFFRPLRQLQKLVLYFKLIKQPGVIFICTTDIWDLEIIAFYQRTFSTAAQVFLHFHQFKQTAYKLSVLRRIASANPHITILAPTSKLAQVFSTNGFKSCMVIPCPTYSHARKVTQETGHIIGKFGKVLYAGAARSDKGFPIVIQLLQTLREANNTIPFEIQISTPNSQRYDQATADALQKLPGIPNINLILHRNTLDQAQYLALFNNAICLLLYDHDSYADKFSGIALDAFYSGCPIITVKNTWMGDTAEKYAAGIALENYALTTIQAAIENIINNYALFHTNAKQAAIELSILHDPQNTLACVQKQLR